MHRRTFVKLITGLLTAASLPQSVRARAVLGAQSAFQQALKEKPWLIGYLGADQTELKAEVTIIQGKIPPNLRGSFLRNGPAMHNIGPDRFMHWFDAPGMIQRFTFSETGVHHHGKLIQSQRSLSETQAGRILFKGFATSTTDLSTGGSADGQNVANISLLEHAGDLLALWEGGSPHIIDPTTLNTVGIKSWSNNTKGLPFGAHPRVDSDGSLWNIGYAINPNSLILYNISPSGTLLSTKVLPQLATPMVHDFMITESKLIITMPPFTATNSEGDSFLDFFEWHDQSNTTILVIDKANLDNLTKIEADPFWVFHFGNAYDITPKEIGFDFALHQNPGFMTHDAYAAMDGSWDGTASAASHYVQGRINLSTQSVQLNELPELGQVEFIQTDARQNLTPHRFALVLAQPQGPSAFGFNRLLLIDRQRGHNAWFDVGESEILEEHLIIPKPTSTDDFWIIGTSLDWQKQITNLNIYEGKHLSDGPIMKASLDLVLPLGLHGTFLPA